MTFPVGCFVPAAVAVTLLCTMCLEFSLSEVAPHVERRGKESFEISTCSSGLDLACVFVLGQKRGFFSAVCIYS